MRRNAGLRKQSERRRQCNPFLIWTFLVASTAGSRTAVERPAYSVAELPLAAAAASERLLLYEEFIYRARLQNDKVPPSAKSAHTSTYLENNKILKPIIMTILIQL